MRRTVLGQVALKLADRPEDYAVEALAYILGQSDAARAAFTKLTMANAAETPQLQFRSQAADGENRPDVVGTDQDGAERLLIEAKFWAGLTEAQPNEYVRRVSSAPSGVVCFVAPEARLVTLRDELARRLQEEKLLDSAEFDESSKGFVIPTNIGPLLNIVSWREVTSSMLAASDIEGDGIVANDIRQLAGLCEAMDEDAFIPLQAHELGPETPRLMMRLSDLVNRVVDESRSRNIADTTGMRSAGVQDGWGRYFTLNGVYVWLGVSYPLWRNGPETPIWMTLQSSAEKRFPKVRSAYSGWELCSPPRIVFDDWDNPLFPMLLERGVEQEIVIDSIIEQMLAVVGPLQEPNADGAKQ